jgi:hypothetical protein
MKNPCDFLADDVVPMCPKAKAFTDALLEFLARHEELAVAKRNVPLYTGHLNSDDWYANEQEAYNRAGDKLHQTIVDETNTESTEGA